MRIARQSLLSGEVHELNLPITPEQLAEFAQPGRTRYVQDIFPQLDPAQREFLLTGITPDEWAAAFPDAE